MSPEEAVEAARLLDAEFAQIGLHMAGILEDLVGRARAQVGAEHVLLGLSGGVDSAVVAALLQRAIGEQLTCVFVDHGLLRQDEGDQVMQTFAQRLKVHVIRVQAERRFFEALRGISDPEEKRKIIGRQFIEVFEEQARELRRGVPDAGHWATWPPVTGSPVRRARAPGSRPPPGRSGSLG